MVFSIFSHVQHGKSENEYFAYSPYVNEMNIWLKHINQVRIIAPISNRNKNILDTSYQHSDLKFIPIPSFSFTDFINGVYAFFAIPRIVLHIFIEMQKADHIHLRCPGNIGLLACFVQIFFPKKPKTIKYAGNWDPNSKQPLSYRLQKKILKSTFLTKNAKVLVYGKWKNQSKNIMSFFTASYSEKEKVTTILDFQQPFRFLFVGTLTKGKNVLYAIELVEKLNEKGIFCFLDIYGKGVEEENLKTYIEGSKYKSLIHLKGNLDKEKMKLQYQSSHFLILASKSEGWPKVVAEAMFWGCVPVATKVSCIPDMLANGDRGILIDRNLETDSNKIITLLQNEIRFKEMSKSAIDWSRKFTADYFESEIKKLLI